MSLVTNRKALLAVALAALLTTAGCSGLMGSEDASADGGAKLDSVPADAQMVGHVDVSGAVADDSLRSLANTMLEAQADSSRYYTGPENVSAMLEQIESESGLDPSGVNGVTFFGTAEAATGAASEHSGMIVTAEYSEDELVSAMEEEGSELSESTYKETTLYTYGYEGDSALAVLGDGTFALGDTAAVESVVDVHAGDADAVDGTLRSSFESTHDGYVRFAMNVPQEEVPADQIGAGSPVNTSAFNTVQFVSGSFYTSGEDVSMDIALTSESESSATRTYDVIDGGISLYSGMTDGELRTALEKLSVSQDGDTVTVSYTNTVSNLETLIETYATATSGSASGSGSDSSSKSVETAPADASPSLALLA